MTFLSDIFNLILYQPLFNALILLYQYLHDFGLAVIVLTCLIRLIFYPLMTQSIETQKVLTELQPKIQEIQEKYKTDKERQVREIIELYRNAKINPLSSFLPFLIQLPILIALFKVFQTEFSQEQLGLLYSFVPHPSQINAYFLGMINLAKGCIEKITANGTEYFIFFWPTIILVILVGATQFIQMKMATPKQKSFKKGPPDFSQMFQKQMLYFFPIFTVCILLTLPAAIALYWITTSLFSIGQQYLILKPRGKAELATGKKENVRTN